MNKERKINKQGKPKPRVLHQDLMVNMDRYKTERLELLAKNFVVNELLKQYKEKIEQALSSNELFLFKNSPSDSKFSDLIKPLREISREINVEWMFLFSFAFYNTVGAPVDVNIEIVGKEGKSILEPGIYVRYHPWMTREDWQIEFENISKIGQTSQDLYPGVRESVFYRKRIKPLHSWTPDDELMIQKYSLIEEKVPKYFEKRISHHKNKNIESAENVGMDSGTSLVDGALEDVVFKISESWKEDDDKRYDKTKKEYRNNYYYLAKKYELPTPEKFSILKKLLK